MSRRAWPFLIVGLALILATTGFLLHQQNRLRLGNPGVRVVNEPVYDPDGKVAGTNSVALPSTVLDYTSTSQPIARIVLDWLPKDTVYGQRHYKASDGFEVAMNVVLMGADRTSIHKPQYCLQGTGWRIDHSESVHIPIQKPHPYALPITKLSLSRSMNTPDGQTVVYHGFYVYWFVADQQLTADHNQRMWWMSRELLRTGILHRWAYVACLVVCLPGQEEAAYQRLSQFISQSVPQFQTTAGPAMLSSTAP